MVGAAGTDGSGQFTIEIEDTYRFRCLYDWRSDFETIPDVYFKMYRGNRFLRRPQAPRSLECRDSARLPSQSKWRGSKVAPVRREMSSLRPAPSPAQSAVRPAPVSADCACNSSQQHWAGVLLSETTTDIDGRYGFAGQGALRHLVYAKTHHRPEVRVLVGDRTPRRRV